MPSSLVPPKQLLGGSDATTGVGKETGSKPSHSSADGVCWNSAPTELSALITTEQPCGPEHAPLQPEKLQPASVWTSSVTEVSSANCALQLARQSIPEGVDTTRPDPARSRPTCAPAFSAAASPGTSLSRRRPRSSAA